MIKTIFPLVALLTALQGAWAEDVRTVTLSEAFLPSQAKPSGEYVVHLPFSVPGNFVKRDVPQEGLELWGTPEDIDVVLKSGSFAHTKNGVFSLKISMGVGYDSRTKEFSIESDMRAKRNKIDGVTDLVIQKDEAQGFPLATVTAISNNRHLFLQYVALGEAALLVNYYHAEPYSDRDLQTWNRFVSGLKSPRKD